MAQYLYQIQPTRIEMVSVGPMPDEQEIVAQHFDYLKRLLAEGALILAGRTTNGDDTTFGIVIFNANSDAEACRIVEQDPAVSGGVMRATLFPYRVALIAEANVQ